MDITRLWIDDGCIFCQACVGSLPEVFTFVDNQAVVLGSVRMDGMTDRNDAAQVALTPAALAAYGDFLADAVAGCPIEIIHAA